MRRLAVIFLVFSLSGCVSLPFNPFGGGDSIEVDAQLGKTNEKTTGLKNDGNLRVGRTRKIMATNAVEDAQIGTVSALGGSSIVIQDEAPFWVWVLVILGWLLPSPKEIYVGLGSLMWSIRAFFMGSKA